MCNDGAFWYCAHGEKLVDMAQEKLKISGEAQSND